MTTSNIKDWLPCSMHEKESQSQLSTKLAQATRQVTVGARYMHYKQLSYKVVALALREEDNEPCVVYQAEYGENVLGYALFQIGLKMLK
jgi:hypothetical protein